MHAGALAVLIVSVAPLVPAAPASDLDALMAEVLEQRDATARRLAAYTFRETEELVVRGQEEVAPLQSYAKEFAWRGRGTALVRQPISVDGAPVRADERSWDPDGEREARLSVDAFYGWDSVFDFPYEPGRYFLAGREMHDGREVLRIEYYPSRFFAGEARESALGRDFDRTSVVTLLVLAGERQIVAWSWESVDLQFLPWRWLLRVSAMEASMELDAGPDGVWLPRRMRFVVRASMAPAQISIELTRTFHDFAGAGDGAPVQRVGRRTGGDAVAASEGGSARPFPGAVFGTPSGDGGPPASGVTVDRVLFHGNFSLADERLADVVGVESGSAYTVDLASTAESRLLASGLVDRAAVRARPVTLQPWGDVALLSVVRQRAGPWDHVQMLPLFDWSDEYGVTAGARVTLVELYGSNERLSFPLAIGGRDRVAMEFVDDFQERFISGVRANGGYLRQVNPHYGEQETRVSASGRLLKRIGRARVDVEAGWAEVEFLGDTDQQVSLAVAARYDTRRETGLPRNAAYLAGAWKPLQIVGGAYRNRFAIDARGYVGALGRSTIVIGAKLDGVDGALPPYEKHLLGGLTTLRGFPPGAFIGDNRLIASAELRAPVWEPLPIVIVGINGFWDTGSVWDDGAAVDKARFHNGVGGGAFLMAGFLRLTVDVGYGLGSGWQLHVGSGLRY